MGTPSGTYEKALFQHQADFHAYSVAHNIYNIYRERHNTYTENNLSNLKDIKQTQDGIDIIISCYKFPLSGVFATKFQAFNL